MDNLFVVTFRQHDLDMCVGSHITEVVYISTEKEMALNFCYKNLNMEEKDEDSHWWFAIHEHFLNEEKQNRTRLVKIIDWNGKELKKHPMMGYSF